MFFCIKELKPLPVSDVIHCAVRMGAARAPNNKYVDKS